MGLFSKFTKKKDKKQNNVASESVEVKKEEALAKTTVAEEVKKADSVTNKNVKPATAKKADSPAKESPVESAAKPPKATEPETKKSTKEKKAEISASVSDESKKSTKKSDATAVKNTNAKNEEPASEVTIDDASADEIATDESAEIVKEKGLSGFFEIKKSKDGRFVFNLYASNRVIIATSQIYSSSASALNGANSVIANAERAAIEDNTLKNPTTATFPKWEIYRDKAEKYRFRLFAPNGSCICHSQGYTSKASCKNGIESIIRTVKDAGIDKSYLKKDKKNSD